MIAIGVRVLVDRRRIGGWWGGAGLLLSPGAVYVPIERWRDTKASIHVDDNRLRVLDVGWRLMRQRGGCIEE